MCKGVECWPGGHAAQLFWPWAEIFPAPHEEQALTPGGLCENWPGSQSVQPVWSGSEYWPASQSLQLPAPPSECFPLPQSRQGAVCCGFECLPAKHEEQLGAPSPE